MVRHVQLLCTSPKCEHIAGSLHRYVFDGKPPDMKSGELVKRAEKRAEAEKELAQAQEQGMYIVHQ